VIFREVPASATRLSLLKGGSVDIAQLLSPTELRSLEGDPRAAVTSVDASQMLWIELNAKFAPLDNPLVRRALNYAFPREEVLATILQGYGRKQTAVMPLVYPGATSEPWQYDTDLDRAKALLAEAGMSGGFKSVLAYNAGNPIEEPVAIMYQTALRRIGVEVGLKKLPAGTYFDNLTKRLEPMIFYLDAPWTPDPGFALNLYFKSTSFVNFSNYVSPEADALIDRSLSTLVEAERMEAVTQAQKVVMADAPWVFVAYPGFQLAHAKSIGGLAYYTSNRLSFQDYARA
jgi:peptide/nickel transport system substrate-binding protein